MGEPPLTGGCGCGGVRFVVTARPVRAVWCHCRRCQRRTGSPASVSAYVAEADLQITAGHELLRAWHPEGSGAKWYCGRCGSHLWGHNPRYPEPYGIRMGAFDTDPGVRPSMRQFVRYAAPWDPIPDDGLPRYDERRP